MPREMPSETVLSCPCGEHDLTFSAEPAPHLTDGTHKVPLTTDNLQRLLLWCSMALAKQEPDTWKVEWGED
jgi:hypothetical protein